MYILWEISTTEKKDVFHTDSLKRAVDMWRAYRNDGKCVTIGV